MLALGGVGGGLPNAGAEEVLGEPEAVAFTNDGQENSDLNTHWGYLVDPGYPGFRAYAGRS